MDVRIKYLTGDDDTVFNVISTKTANRVVTIEAEDQVLYVNMDAVRFVQERGERPQ